MAKPQVYGSCRLCATHDKLVRSHLIPEFFYSDLYSKEFKGRYLTFAESSDRIFSPPEGALAESFCHDCDTKRVSEYETYVAPLFRQGF